MLFGHQNDDANQSAVNTPAAPAAGVNPLAVDPDTGASLPVAPAEPPTPPESSVLNQPTAPSLDASTSFTDVPSPSSDTAAVDASLPLSAPAVQATAENVSPFSALSNPGPANDTSHTTTEDAGLPAVSNAQQSAQPQPTYNNGDATDLLGLKQQALSQLEPLVDQLDQTPEEKFRTTMMLIQSTDNQALIQDAYDAAQAITDEKIRAQALLDVINEINYFTQQQSKE